METISDNEENQNKKGDEESQIGDDNEKLQESEVYSWNSAKNYMSKLASGKYNNLGTAVSKHIKAYGGSKAASKTARAGINTVIRLGNFATSSPTSTFRTVLEEYKIEYENKSAREVLNELTNLIAPLPITKDDSIARKALIITMEFIYEMFDEENLDYDSIDIDSLNLIIPKFIENYIYERIINDLGSRIESYSENSDKAMETESDLKDYINSKVEIVFKGKDFSKINFNDSSTKQEVERLFNQCYTLMEN